MDRYLQRLAEVQAFRAECAEQLRALADDSAVLERGSFTDDEQSRFDQLAEWVEEARSIEADLERKIAVLEAAEAPGAQIVRGDSPNINVNRANDVDFDALTRGTLSPVEVRDAALATIERGAQRFGSSPEGLANAERLARKGEAFARHIATFGQDVYAEAWAKRMTGKDYLLSDAEARALAVGTGTSAGNLVPTHLDPSIILTNAGSYNPFRRVARVVSLPSPGPNTWNGVTSAGVTASWDAEAAEVSDDSPETANPSIPVYKGAAYVAASYEAIEDVANLAGEVVRMFADAKDRLESAAFATGTGSAQPTGLITDLDANTFVEVSNTTAATLGLVDLHNALNGLSARYRDRATWIMSPAILGTVEQLGAGLGGANSVTNINSGYSMSLLGRPVELSSSYPGTPSSTTQVENWLTVGDMSQFVIVDKIGVRTVFNPVTLGANRRPDGGAGWYMHWRAGSETTYEGTATTNRAFVLLQDITSA